MAGAGVGVALAADLAIAADDTQFNLAYARIGTTPDAGATWLLPRLIGLRRALEMALLTETYDAAEALRLGLVNRVVPSAALEAETDALARRLASGPTLAHGRAKRLIRAALDVTLKEQLEAERATFKESTRTADYLEGVAAFVEKRRRASAVAEGPFRSLAIERTSMKVGFIGTGTMGAGMALNLRKAGHDLVVHDVRKESAQPHIAAGATWAETVADVGRAADVVFTSLPGPREMQEVGTGEGGLLELYADGHRMVRPLDQLAHCGAGRLQALPG